jgi:hypothetical protein
MKLPMFFSKFRSLVPVCFSMALALFFGPLLPSLHAEGALLWEVDFSDREVGPTSDFGKNLEIREENGLKFLSKQDHETQLFLDQGRRISGSKDWIDYVYTVRFRQSEKFTTILVVKAGGERPEVPYLWYYVTVSSSGIAILCHGLPKGEHKDDPRRKADVSFESMGASTLSPGEWITARVEVGNEVIKVAVDAGDQQPRSAEFKVFPGTGGVFLAARAPVDVAKASVHEVGQAVMPSP